MASNLRLVGVQSPWYTSLVAAKNVPTQDLKVDEDPVLQHYSVNLEFD